MPQAVTIFIGCSTVYVIYHVLIHTISLLRNSSYYLLISQTMLSHFILSTRMFQPVGYDGRSEQTMEKCSTNFRRSDDVSTVSMNATFEKDQERPMLNISKATVRGNWISLIIYSSYDNLVKMSASSHGIFDECID